ncbi:uncharacterized protein LOC116342192 isoform X2 [Contarinia nasturtii]|uniref:uncharacterized protein LOC116342192 isoform X2 n=1 Tax=Contarinia nasturtii TaxID=265458 RepID=UPI0012D3F5C8|nr:uncharacterized protein LOC116342192 isoform X2 [Contarinia nasturtii]
MVIGEKDESTQPGAVTQMPPASIDNIMSGISNTGSVKMNNHRKKLRQRFDIIKKLGQGTYGKVQLGINKETSQDVAIKTIKKCKIETEADLVRIRREVQIMSSVQHPNIIHIYEVFENREKMVLVMEFAAGGELYDYLSERKVLTEEEARRIFRQIATAVYYCHKHKICHRDLKLENILLDEHGNAKIADFGLSNVFEEKRLLATFCGSPLYASPEIVKGTPYQGPEVDCWSLGVLLYTLVYGAMPFDGSNFKRLVKQISAGDYYEPKKPSNASPLIREMLTVCPKRRATIEQICNHWWVNESYTECCLNLAEELANQTPVRLDVLLSLTPSAVTCEQLVVPNPHEVENKQNVTRSMSVGSIRDIGDIANSEAEQRIIEMVAAGGEAALAPSPTRTITPSPSMVPQVKRKPENTISTESMTGVAGARKRDKPTEQIKGTQSKLSISEIMDVDESTQNEEQMEKNVAELSSSTLADVVDDELKKDEKSVKNKSKTSSDTIIEEVPPNALQKTQTSEPKAPKTFPKTKTTDLSEVSRAAPPAEQKLADEPKPSTERRKSRIMEVAERFEAAAAAPTEKPKKVIVKKDVERKTSAPKPTTTSTPVAEKQSKPATNLPQQSSDKTLEISKVKSEMASANSSAPDVDLTKSDSKTSNLSLEEARRSMENSIALLNQARMESSNEVDQLCAKTENVAVSSKQDEGERQRKLKTAREIIGNAIPRFSGMGVRKPPVPFGANGRSISGSVVPTRNVATPPDPRLHERESPLSIYNSRPAAAAAGEQGVIGEEQPKTSDVTLKSATLPRRKIGRPDVEQQQQYHPTYNPVFATSGARGGITDAQSQQQHKPKEHYIPIQRVGYVANTSSSQRSVLSRQSTNDSDISDTQTASTATIGTQPSLQTSNSSQPIKKSPREFIIPIAVEGGGFVTPRAGSLEPSESNHSTSTAFSRFSGRPRKISSLFNDSEDESINSPFHRMQRHTSIGRDSDTETSQPTTGFTYRLRSTRPFKKLQSEGNDSGSSGEEDDDDGFEILTAENLFSTLLSRVRALTNRLNVKDDPTSDFPSARFLNNFPTNFRQNSPFWQHDPFTSRLNSSGAWRHSMTRDLGTDIDSMNSVFSPRTGATLPKGAKFRSSGEKSSNLQSNEYSNNSTNSTTTPTTTSENPTNQNDNNLKQPNNETLDLADLDLSQLRLTKKDLETLSSITPSLPKHFQDQLLAQLPPNQARKLSRTLSMQASTRTPNIYKRSLSSGRDGGIENTESTASKTPIPEHQIDDLKFGANDPKFNGMDPNATGNESSLLSFDRNSVLRRSMSRGRDPTVHRRSTSALRNEYPSRMSYAGDLRADYKPNDSVANNRYRLTDYTSGLGTSALRPEYYSKLPLPTSSSPQKSPSNETLDSPFRRRHSSRGFSRFSSRPDFYGSSSSINAGDDGNALLKVRGEKERETQSVLREIRERSRDRSKTTPSKNETKPREGESLPSGDACSTHKDHRRKSSIPNIRITVDKQNGRIYHARNKSMERCCDIDDAEKIDGKESGHIRRASMTNAARPPNSANEARSKQTAAEFTDDILSELVRRSKDYTENGDLPQKTEKKDESGTVKKIKIKSKDGKKMKTKPKTAETGEQESKVTQNNEQSNDVQSVTLPLPKSSKIARRMSFPNKDDGVSDKVNDRKSEIMEKKCEAPEINVNVPKSNDAKETKTYPNSKLTPPKEVSLKIKKSTNSSATSTSRNAITAVMEKFMEKSAERLSPGKTISATKVKSESGETSPPKTKKKIKVVKKLVKPEQSPTKETSPKSNETSNETSPVKERKSPEKKLKSGFLYTIGQKFEKMRENSKNKEKEKKIAKTIDAPIAAASEIDIKLPMHCEKEFPKDVETVQTIIIPRRVKDGQGEIIQKEEITIRQIDLPSSISANSIGKGEQRKSRIDAVIRNLRERSVPHTVRSENRTDLATESALLKRAVSVEDMTNGAVNFNKQGNVNKVLGLFRRIEKEHQLQKQQHLAANGESSSKERPKSGGFVGKMKKSRPYYTGAKSDTIITLTDQFERQYLCERANQLKAENSTASSTKIPYLRASSISKTDSQPIQSNSFEFVANGTKEKSTSNNSIDEKVRDIKHVNEAIKPQIPIVDVTNSSLSEKERIRNNRKGLVLDLSNEQYNDHFKKISNDSSNNNNNSYHFNSSKSFGDQCNGSNENHVNNNFAGNGNYYPQFYPHSDRNHEPFTPTCELNTSYSSDARSVRDDCESTSTFLSPTDEPELCFDDWSACSGSTDDHMPLHPKHLKYASMRNQSEQNHNQMPSTSTDPAPSTPSDSESVIDRIKRRSYYCRFNEKKPKRTSSIVGPSAQREYYRDMAAKSKSRASDYLPLTPNGYQTESDGSFSRGGSKSPTPMNVPTSISRANTPSCYSTADESEKFKQQPYHYHFHHQRSQTPSRSVKSPFEPNDLPKNKSSEYLNLRSTLTSPPASISVSKYYSNPIGATTSLPTSDYQHNGNRSYSMRNSTYDSLTTPIVYGTYNPKRRMSTSYLAPSIVAANSTNGYLSSPKDHLSTSCYATLGRSKPKAYDRSITMLDTGSIAPTSILTKRFGTTNSTSDNPYTHSHYRPIHEYGGHFNSRSSLRSPTIIQSSSSNV